MKPKFKYWNGSEMIISVLLMGYAKSISNDEDPILLEWTKTQDRFEEDLYDGDIVQPLRELKGGWGKGLNFVIIYDPVHNRWGAHWRGHDGKDDKKDSSFFITPANTKNLKKMGNIFEHSHLINKQNG